MTHMLARLFNQPVFGHFEINGWWRCLLRNCFRFCLIWQYFTIHTTVYVCVSRYFLIPALYNDAVTGSFGSICSFSFSSVFKIFFMFIFLRCSFHPSWKALLILCFLSVLHYSQPSLKLFWKITLGLPGNCLYAVEKYKEAVLEML